MIYSEIKRILRERKLSVEWLAREIGMKPSTLYTRFAKDSDTIDLALILKICELLQLPVEHFVGGVWRSSMQPTLQEWEMLHAWRGLDDDGRELISLMIEKISLMEKKSISSYDG